MSDLGRWADYVWPVWILHHLCWFLQVVVVLLYWYHFYTIPILFWVSCYFSFLLLHFCWVFNFLWRVCHWVDVTILILLCFLLIWCLYCWVLVCCFEVILWGRWFRCLWCWLLGWRSWVIIWGTCFRVGVRCFIRLWLRVGVIVTWVFFHRCFGVIRRYFRVVSFFLGGWRVVLSCFVIFCWVSRSGPFCSWVVSWGFFIFVTIRWSTFSAGWWRIGVICFTTLFALIFSWRGGGFRWVVGFRRWWFWGEGLAGRSVPGGSRGLTSASLSHGLSILCFWPGRPVVLHKNSSFLRCHSFLFQVWS